MSVQQGAEGCLGAAVEVAAILLRVLCSGSQIQLFHVPASAVFPGSRHRG